MAPILTRYEIEAERRVLARVEADRDRTRAEIAARLAGDAHVDVMDPVSGQTVRIEVRRPSPPPAPDAPRPPG